MRLQKISYVGAVLAGVLLLLSCWYCLLAADVAGIKKEAIEFQRLAESLQSQVSSRRQQLQVHQQKLAKGSAIGDTVGPAVVKDLLAMAEKPSGNVRLKELLQKHGVKVQISAAEVPAPQPVKKGVN
jgi:hypothetical protein